MCPDSTLTKELFIAPIPLPLELPLSFRKRIAHLCGGSLPIPDLVSHREIASAQLRRQLRHAAVVAIDAPASGHSFPVRLGHAVSLVLGSRDTSGVELETTGCGICGVRASYPARAALLLRRERAEACLDLNYKPKVIPTSKRVKTCWRANMTDFDGYV
jgi:hypothetical protein